FADAHASHAASEHVTVDRVGYRLRDESCRGDSRSPAAPESHADGSRRELSSAAAKEGWRARPPASKRRLTWIDSRGWQLRVSAGARGRGRLASINETPTDQRAHF